MDKVLTPLRDFIDWIGYAGGKSGSLTHLQFVLWKVVETSLDVKRLRTGLFFNIYAKPFCLLNMTNPRKNDPKYEDASKHALQKNNENYATADNECF